MVRWLVLSSALLAACAAPADDADDATAEAAQTRAAGPSDPAATCTSAQVTVPVQIMVLYIIDGRGAVRAADAGTGI